MAREPATIEQPQAQLRKTELTLAENQTHACMVIVLQAQQTQK